MAARFWVGGTGTWDSSDTTHWAASTGAGGGQPVPTSADSVTFDGSSGGGTVTVNHATLSVSTLTMGAFTGTLDFSANNQNITIGAGGCSISGTGARTLNMGNGTWTITAASGAWVAGTVTSLTFNANSSTLLFSNTTSTVKTITLGTSLSYNIVTFAAQTSRGGFQITTGTTPTFATWNVLAPNYVIAAAGLNLTVTNALTVTGTRTSPVGFAPLTDSAGGWTITSGNNETFDWCSFRQITLAGAGTPTVTSSFDLGINSGITIGAPSAGGSVGIIGS